MVELLCHVGLRLSCAYVNLGLFVASCHRLLACWLGSWLRWSSLWCCPLASTVLVTTLWAWLGFVVCLACARQWPLSHECVALVSYVLGFVCLLTVCTLRCDMVGSLAFMYQELTREVDVTGNVCMKGCCLLAARMLRSALFEPLRSALLGICVGFVCTRWCLASCVACLPRVSCILGSQFGLVVLRLLCFFVLRIPPS